MLPEGIFADLAELNELNLASNELESLPEGVFDGLVTLGHINLSQNPLTELRAGVFAGLSALELLELIGNDLSSLPEELFSGLTALTDLYLNGNDLSSLPEELFSGLTAVDTLYLDNNNLSSLDAGLFSGLTALIRLELKNNALSSLPAGLFSGLTALTKLTLGGNSTNPMELTVTVEKVGTNQVRAKVLAGAPFAVAIPVTLVNGTLAGSVTELSVAAGEVYSEPVTMTRTAGTTTAATVDVDLTTQPTLPADHRGYTFVKATVNLPATILPDATNAAPAFTSSTTFNPAENQTAVGTVEAEDIDTTDEITGYALNGGTDQALFSITSGALTFQAALNYEDPQDADTDNAYVVVVRATSGTGARVKTADQTITVTVMDVDEQPDKPAKPTVTAVSGSSTSLDVSWTEPGLNGGPAIIGYQLRYRSRASATDPWSPAVDWPHTGTTTTTTITGLTATTEYVVQVKALNGETATAYSTVSDVVSTNAETPTVPPGPAAPTNFMARPAGDAKVALSWDAPASDSGVMRHEYQFETDGSYGNWARIANSGVGGANQASFTASGLTNEVPHTFQLRAVSGDGDGGEAMAGPVTPTPGICDRTQQVQDAILAKISGVDDCAAVTVADLATVTAALDLEKKSIMSLKAGDFSGLTAVTSIDLSFNEIGALPADLFSGLTSLQTLRMEFSGVTSLPADAFSGLTALRRMRLSGFRLGSFPANQFSGLTELSSLFLTENGLTDLPPGLFSGLSKLQVINLDYNELGSLPAGVFSGLSKMHILSLVDNQLTSLPSGLFSGVTALEELSLDDNQLTSLPDGLFSGVTVLRKLSLGDNPADPMPLTVTLEKVGTGQVRAKVLAGAPSDLVLPVSVENGTLAAGATGLRVAKGSVAGDPVSVIRTGDTGDVTVDLGTPLPSLPPEHSGCEYAKAASGLPVEVPDALEREPGVEGEFRLAPDTVEDYADDTLDRLNGHVGRVEVFHAERWGTVSDDGLLRTGNEASALVCQAMDYTTGEFASGYGQPGVPSQPSGPGITVFYPVGSTYPAHFPLPIWLDDLSCRAGDPDLTGKNALNAPMAHCGYTGWGLHNSTHSEDAGVRCWNELESGAGHSYDPLTAAFEGLPEAHDGETAFSFRLAFSEAVAVTPEAMRTRALTVAGGAVTGAARVDGETGVWVITVTPDSREDLSITLARTEDCEAEGAVCTSDGRTLSAVPAHIVPGPGPETEPALTASFEGLPEVHDGEEGFHFRVAFSEDIGIGFRSMRDDSFTVDGGEVTAARRVEGRHDLWRITVEPDSDEDVAIALPGGRECAVSGAICTRGENRRQLANTPTATVAGPPESNTAATGTPAIGGTPQVGEELTASTSGISDADGLDNTSFRYQWIRTDADIGGATGSTYTPVAADAGERLKVRVSFTDDAGHEESLTSAATDAVGPPENTAATGTPAIGGTAQVGEELTASTSGISDADGLDNASFRYQWIRTDADIGGATGSTYTAVDADEGARLKVRVGFTDDAGNAESLTSAATDAVAAAPEPLTAAFEGMPAEHAGQGSFSFRVAFSDGINISYKTVRDASFTVTGGAVTRASRVDKRRDLWKITVEPDSDGAVTIRLPETTDCGASGAICTGDGRPLSHALSATVAGPVGIAVADARVEEGDGVALAFVVTLSRAASAAMTVDYTTADGSAHAGDDYRAASGTLTFGAGESSKTIEVGVLDDAHDEGEETLTPTLSNASSGRLTDGEATGTIKNHDPMPRALLARFGRAAAVQVVEQVEERLEASREPGFRGRFAGRELRRGMERDIGLSLIRRLGGAAGVGRGGVGAGASGPMAGAPGAAGFEPPGPAGGGRRSAPALPMGGASGAAPSMTMAPSMGAAPSMGGGAGSMGMAGPMGGGAGSMGMAGPMGGGAGSMGMAGPMGGGAGGDGGFNGGGLLRMGLGGGDVLTGSAFALNRETGGGGVLSLWSRGARSRFSGREGALSLGGDVRTTMFGADYARGPLVVGLSLSDTRGLGEYSGPGAGRMLSSVTGLYPWLGYRATDRITVWGVTGYGVGGMLLTPAGGPALESGLTTAMAAAGTRGELVGGGADGFALAFKADVLWAGTAIDGVDGPEGRLVATAAGVTRVRTGLEGSRGFTFGGGGLSLRPSVEVGLRHDGGDAETGAGVDVGGGLVASHASSGLAADVRVRTLLVHEAEGFREHGVSLSLSWNPTPSTPLGLTARVAPSWGGQATGGADALWGRDTMAGMGAHGGLAAGNRLDGEVGYGLPVGRRFVGTPRVGFSTSEYGQDYRVGYGLGLLDRGSLNFELGVEAQRRNSPMLGGASDGVLGRAMLGW